MPIAPSQKTKIEKELFQGFKPTKKKVWDPPNKNCPTVEDLVTELDNVRTTLLAIAEVVTNPCEVEKLKEAKDTLIGTARHLESLYFRLLNNGVRARYQDLITVYRPDDTPF